MSPVRVQRKRVKGWRMPEGAVYVGRPTVYGNPFRPSLEDGAWVVRDDNGVDYDPDYNFRTSAIRCCVELFAEDLTYWFGGRIRNEPGLRDAIEGLRGKDLACWCPIDQPCHADVLLELANQAVTTGARGP